VHYYRQDAAKRQTAGIKFTHRPKNQDNTVFDGLDELYHHAQFEEDRTML